MNEVNAIRDLSGVIFTLRGQRVILDPDLAALYGVSTSQLNQQIKRNSERFPVEFAFRLNKGEMQNLRS